MDSVRLEAIMPPLGNDDRVKGFVEVVRNQNTYPGWVVFFPPEIEGDFHIYLEDVLKQQIFNDVDRKEALWASLENKEVSSTDPFTQITTTRTIEKSEVVCADDPDYYMLRRAKYPSLADQLDALWKGSDSEAYASMSKTIREIKLKYPKP